METEIKSNRDCDCKEQCARCGSSNTNREIAYWYCPIIPDGVPGSDIDCRLHKYGGLSEMHRLRKIIT